MNSSCTYAASDGTLSEPLAISAACFAAMGLFCCVQMYFLIGITFKRRSGLYFWSLVGATSAQLLNCFYVFLTNWILQDRLPGISLAIGTIGSMLYPPFEFLVLYSRLHLLAAGTRELKIALVLTILEAVLAEIPLAISGILVVVYPESSRMARSSDFWWEWEAALYPAVDFALCFLYFLQVKRMWGDSDGKMRWVLWHVITMSTLLILIDISFLILANVTNWNWANALATFFFALKLQIEIYTLNLLTGIASRSRSEAQGSFGVDSSVATDSVTTSDAAMKSPVAEPQSRLS